MNPAALTLHDLNRAHTIPPVASTVTPHRLRLAILQGINAIRVVVTNFAGWQAALTYLVQLHFRMEPREAMDQFALRLQESFLVAVQANGGPFGQPRIEALFQPLFQHFADHIGERAPLERRCRFCLPA